MPNMFSRRRGMSNPPMPSSTSSAAQAAATGAFLRKPASSASLSSAAAAAALRSQASSPIDVGSIQTKRMVRRGSVSSVGSGSVMGSSMRGGPTRAGIQRQNSGGSMTERTFRSPSPGRMNGAVSPAPDAPPVPAVPRLIPGGHKRAASLDPPQRIMSPTPSRGGRGSSVDRNDAHTPTTSRLTTKLSGVLEAEELERQNNSGTNFSRPMSQQSTPVPSSSKGSAKQSTRGAGTWFTQADGTGSTADTRSPAPSAPSARSSQRAQAGFVQQEVRDAANKPVKKKKTASTTEGSHLAQANNNNNTGADYQGNPGVSYGSEDAVMVYDPNTRTFTAKPREQSAKEPEPPSPTISETALPPPGTYDPGTRSIVPVKTQASGKAPTTSGASESDATPTTRKKQRPAVPPVETSIEPPPRNPARISPSASPTSSRAAGLLHKQPSVVREDPEGEEAAAAGRPIPASLKATGQSVQTSAGPARMYVAPTRSHGRSTSLDIPRQSVEGGGRGRIGSLSPNRSAHFSSSLVTEGTPHAPPPRSVSPMKSAMKHASPASSVRTASPTATFSSPSHKAPPSDAPDNTSLASVDGLIASRKKKSVRVSFDEHPEEIEAVEQPKTVPRERSPAIDDDMDDLMKPRPALPSFGSLRRSSGSRGPEALGKATETKTAAQDGGMRMATDEVVGGILATHAAEQAANKPVVSEGKGEATASSVTDDSDDDFEQAMDRTSNNSVQETSRLETADVAEPKTKDFATRAGKRLAPDSPESSSVPAINLLPPTPGEEVGNVLEEEQESERRPNSASSHEGFNVPGSWAHSNEKNIVVEPHHPADPTTAMTGPSEPSPADEPTSARVDTLAHEQQRANLAAINEDEDTDDSAAFSDAAEDLSDLEDGGFASMDAIVSSPVVSSTPEKAKTSGVTLTTPPDSPIAEQAANNTGSGTDSRDTSGTWNAATAYWKQLSKQQRAQIEREHLSSDDEARPVITPNKKPRKKKSAAADVAAGGAKDDVPHQEAQPAQQRSAPLVGSQTAMPKTMRARQAAAPAGSDNEVHMRKSMRGSSSDTGGRPAPASSDGEVHMRRSMRGNSGNTGGGGGGMQSTMRSGPPPQQRPQSESAGPRKSAGAQSSGLLAQRQRADSDTTRTSQDSAFPKVQQQRASLQASSPPAPSGAFTSKLQRQTSNDSDSESSFRKKRKVPALDSAGRYSMKRSMRGGSSDQGSIIEQRPVSPTPAPPKKSGGAFSIRSLSPTGSSMFGRGKGDKMRESLRSAPVESGPQRMSLRNGQGGAGGGPTMRGAGSGPTMRGAPSQPKSSMGAALSKPRFRSRFADSDDEDEQPRRNAFRSRYVDSDDDEPASPRVIPADLTPVRGIPRRQGRDDGDSTDLEDEAADTRKAPGKQSAPGVPTNSDIDKAMEAARRKLGIPAATADATSHETRQGDMLSKGSLRQPAPSMRAEPSLRAEPVQPNGTLDKKKRGFMGSILRRNRHSTASVQQVAPASLLGASYAQGSASSPNLALASPSKPQDLTTPSSPAFGRLVRRGSQQPKLRRGDSSYSTSTAPIPTYSTADNDVPAMPPVPKITANGLAAANRPTTSDGVSPEAIKLARTMRPDLAPRSQTGAESGHRVRIAAGSKEDDGKSAIYSARTGKKKRFSMLRKAFGLND